MQNVILHTFREVSPEHEIIEEQQAAADEAERADKFERWEALRDKAHTIGTRCALDWDVALSERSLS